MTYESAAMSKIGNFDWIVDFSSLSPFLDFKYIGISQEERKNKKVLVVGCGTSTLSHCLAETGFSDITSIDYDEEIIKHMSNIHSSDTRLKWYKYDIVTGEDILSHGTAFANSTYEIIIDKGTLDAILVEGSVCTMLYDIHRLLKTGGIYFVCSLFSTEVIYPLLSMEALGMSVNKHVTESHKINADEEIMTGNIFICHKLDRINGLDLDMIRQQESAIMNDHYQERSPLLTDDKIAEIKDMFRDRSGIPLPELHKLLFGKDLMLGYDYDLFMEDISKYNLKASSEMDFEEVIIFLKENQ